MRKDVMSLASKLSASSGINADHLYYWLIELGKNRGKNPRYLPIAAARGRVIAMDNPDQDYIELFNPATGESFCDYDGPDYEELILIRQEAWMD